MMAFRTSTVKRKKVFEKMLCPILKRTMHSRSKSLIGCPVCETLCSLVLKAALIFGDEIHLHATKILVIQLHLLLKVVWTTLTLDYKYLKVYS